MSATGRLGESTKKGSRLFTKAAIAPTESVIEIGNAQHKLGNFYFE